ncbi:MAG TPA: hypothetical protein VER58_20700 [Thermoanaerobaculia bacterium]|nr:hypothetical protein [Thermoanaerobaculia bacterium]
MKDDAGLREVFRGDHSSVEMAGAMLEELGIASHRRWEQAGGVQFSASETAMIPGREAVLLVPSIAYDEAKEALAGFHSPEPDYVSELSSEIAANQRKRRGLAAFILIILFGPFAIALIAMMVVLVGSLFK